MSSNSKTASEATGFSLDRLDRPIVQAPMGGGPSTPALAAAVSAAGGLGFLAAGYRTPDAVRDDLREVRAQTGRPFGVNMFVPSPPVGARGGVRRYAEALRGEAERYGVELGEPRHDDDGFGEKLAVVAEERVAVVSFTFGCPDAAVVEELHSAGVAVWPTVTTPAEAARAEQAGADALVVQGVEAGGHRGSFDDAAPGDVGLLALLQLVAAEVDLPMVAAGGIVSGRAVAAVLAAGAEAAALGTAFMLTPEAGTSQAHREAISSDADTGLTRVFTGRTARGVVNRFMREHAADAPSAYPEVHHLTAPIRAAARRGGDPDGFHLWAGQAHALAEELPAGELVARLAEEARDALRAASRLAQPGAPRVLEQ
jgi:nitronate monooxygenase